MRRMGKDENYTGFPDDLFTCEKEFVMETCALMKRKLPGNKWSCIVRFNTVDREMLETMKDAG